jgi:DNA modification methylase
MAISTSHRVPLLRGRIISQRDARSGLDVGGSCRVPSPSWSDQSTATGSRCDRKIKPVTLRQNQTAADSRNRSNVWNAPGANSFARSGPRKQVKSHPTVKPIALVADAILDCTQRNDIVIDPYLGSGTTILAAERTGRRCHAIEIDGRYVDTAIKRWERLTKQEAKNVDGNTFAQMESDRRADQ